MTTEVGEFPTLRKLVMKGVTTKAQAREALDELTELIEQLDTQKDTLEEGVFDWEEGDDAETRAAGKETIEQVVNDIDSPLTNAGRACGMADYEPKDPT